MIITQQYLKTLIGQKITLIKTNLPEFNNTYNYSKRKPVGKIIGITNHNQLKIRWYTKNHPNYMVDIHEDTFEINENKQFKKRNKKQKSFKNKHKNPKNNSHISNDR